MSSAQAASTALLPAARPEPAADDLHDVDLDAADDQYPAGLRLVPAPRRRERGARPAGLAWSCENCERVNEGRRKRCRDCGTSQF